MLAWWPAYIATTPRRQRVIRDHEGENNFLRQRVGALHRACEPVHDRRMATTSQGERLALTSLRTLDERGVRLPRVVRGHVYP